jgi:small subunit ribosomal protein S20
VANTKQARKRAEQASERRERNVKQRSKMRTAIKKATATIKAGDSAKATDAVKIASQSVDMMATKGLIHKNKAARHKSRLSAHLKKTATKA